MKTTKCDRCGCDEEHMFSYKCEPPVSALVEEFDLCIKCLSELRNWLDRGKY